jgi:competence protein ComEC
MCLLVFVTLALGWVWARRLPPLGRAVWGAVLFALLGAASAQLEERPLQSGPTRCVGRIQGGLFGGRCLVRTGWVAARLRVVSSPGATQHRVFELSGVIVAGPTTRNPGDPDRRLLNLSAGVGGTLRLQDPLRLIDVASPRKLWFADNLLRLRHEVLFDSLDETGIVGALSVGVRSRVPRPVVEAFRKAGMAHLLAISGFHVAVLAGAIFLVIGGFLRRLPVSPAAAVLVRAVVTLTAVALYAWQTGGSASTVRAAGMAALLLGRTVVGRPGGSLLHPLSLAGLCYLLLRPGALVGAGFLMSYLAVYGLIRDGRRSRALIVGTLCAILFTAPVSSSFFGVLAPVGLVSNLVAAPLAAAVIGGAATTHLMPLPSLSAYFASGTDLLGATLVRIAVFFSYWPPVDVPTWRTGFLVVSLIAGRIPRAPAGRRWITSVLMVISVSPGPQAGTEALRVTYLDVGHGDAALLQTPSGRSLLVDTGSRSRWPAVRSVLRNAGVRTIDSVVISHAHADHAGSLDALLREFEVTRVVVSRATLLSLPVLRQATVVSAGDVIPLDPEVRLLVLGPSAGTVNRNNESLVLLLVHGENRFLFPGDSEFRSERDLVHRWGSFLASDVVKVPHHGSKSSSSPFFVDRASKAGRKWAVVSVDNPNRFGFPAESAVRQWTSHGFTLFSTGTSGAIRCESTSTALDCFPALLPGHSNY